MSRVRDVTEWFRLIQEKKDDLEIAHDLLDRLTGYSYLASEITKDDLALLISLFTAIRLDQMAKEGS